MRARAMPARRSSLIGRDHDLAAIGDLALHSDGRLVTLTGVGGVGKTTLGRAVGASLDDRFPDGVWPVDLAPLPDGADDDAVALACLTGLDLVEQARPTLDVVIEHLEPRQALLFLDNCEHVHPAVASVVNALLDACPYLRIVATSRTPLRVRGESVVRVQPLETPATRGGVAPASLASVPAVELFLLRARAADPTFELSDRNAAAVAALCRRLAGLPLAIELAAAHVKALTPAEIDERLGADSGLLATDTVGTAARQRSLDDTLEWSHRLLTPEQQALFRRLAVFAGSWTLEAAEAVCAIGSEPGAGGVEPGSIASGMGALVEHSLVVRDANTSPSRFRFLQPIAEFAARKLAASGEEAVLGIPHARYYLALAALRVPGPLHATPPDLERIAADYDNCVAALRLAERAAVLPLVAGFVGALTEYWRIRGHLREGVPHLEALMALAGDAPTRPRGVAVAVLSDFERLLGQLEAAEDHARESIRISDVLGDNYSRRITRGLLAEALAARGDAVGARMAFEEARRILEEEPSPIALGFYHVGVGLIALRDGQRGLDEAYAHLCAAVELLQASGRTWYRGRSLVALGAVERRRGELDVARTHLADGFAELVAYGARVDAIETIEELGRVALDRGDGERAARLFGAASSLRDAMAVPGGPGVRAMITSDVDRIRAMLGAHAFADAWSDGRAMSFEDVARVASEPEASLAARRRRPRRARTSTNGQALTRREQEIADLVARGLTNPQIADELFISPATARVHVERILGKLGLTSRVQVATWVVESRRGGTSDPIRE